MINLTGHWTRTLFSALLILTTGAAFGQQGQPIGFNNQPNVNLGFTSFLDGAPPHRDSAVYYQQYLQHYSSDEFRDGQGSLAPLPVQPEVDVIVWINQLVLQSDKEMPGIGGRLGLNVIVPVVQPDLDGGILPITDSGSGLGDISIGPSLQWGPIMGEKGPLMTHRLELAMLIPTGEYSEIAAVNAGSNFLSFNPYWAGTLFLGPRLTASWRLHYLWNDKNEDPNTFLFPGASSTQAGEAVHMNFSAAFAVIPERLRLGINGYFLKQLSDFEVDGVKIANSREKVTAIGPGAVLHLSPRDTFFFNVYFESDAENRTEGDRAVIRYVHQF